MTTLSFRLNKSKNFFYLLLPLFIFLIFNFSVHATQAATLTAGSVSASPGATGISVPITLTNGTGDQISAANFDLTYDQNSLVLTNVTVGTAASNAGKGVSYSTPSAGTIRVVIYGVNQTAIANGAVANIIFNVSSSAAAGDKALAFSAYAASNPTAGDVSLSVVSGKVTVMSTDTTAPTRSSGSPSGSLATGTTQATLSLVTNEAATCKYSTSANTAYASMANTFSTTGGTTHSTAVTGLTNGSTYNYYVRCKDAANNANADDYVITFSVAAAPVDTTAPTRSSGSPSGSLATGTTQATLSLVTNEAATCKYSTSANTAYASMANTFSTTGGTTHSTAVTGLTNGSTYNYYVRCKDAANNANADDYVISFSVAAPGPVKSITSYKTSEILTIDGKLNESTWSQANCVTFSNASKSNNIAKACTLWDNNYIFFAYQVTDMNIEAVTTARDDGAVWVDDGAEVFLDTAFNKGTVMQTDDYHYIVNINGVLYDSKGTGGVEDSGWNSSGFVSARTNTSNGYILEMKIPLSEIGVSNTGGKTLGLLLVNGDRDNNVGYSYDWMDVINTGGAYAQPNLWGQFIMSTTVVNPIDTTAPTRSSGSPSGSLATGTTQATLSLVTNEAATCKYATSANTAYASMASTFSTTGGTTHSTAVTGLTNGSTYNYYVRCKDAANNANADDYVITFSVAAAPVDTTAPTRSSGSPSGSLATGTTQATLSLVTNEAATCKYATSANTAYASMASTFSTTGGTTHSTAVTGLTNGSTYNYYVRCKDAANNANADDYVITFSVSSPLTLSVALSTSATSGQAPLNSVSLTGTVSGTATGNINYTFYCNRSDAGTNITTPYDAKYDSQTVTTKTATSICNYTAAGTYTAKVIAERGTLQAESRVTINVSAPPPPPTNGSLTALKTLSNMTIDGSLSESAWLQANSVTFTNAAHSDNTATVYALWDSTNLYLAFAIKDSKLEALATARDGNTYMDDGVDLYFDSAFDKTTALNTDDYQYVFNINNVLLDDRGTSSGTKDNSWNGKAVSGRTNITGGYILEIKIPFSDWSLTPTDNKQIGALLANDDMDNGASDTYDWVNLITKTGDYSQPNNWGQIILSPTTAGGGSELHPPSPLQRFSIRLLSNRHNASNSISCNQ